jgi:2-keto-3-deoxy-L-rhamnonate aldolase RhmA
MNTPWFTPNRLKQALRAGKTAVGTMLIEIRQPSVMQFLANAGFDFVLIDNEHGPFTIETIADLSRAARSVGITPIVRVPELTYAAITQPLDAGAQGIMAPRITDRAEVLAVLQMMKYPPAGKRGSVMARGHMNFQSGAVGEAMEAMNEETLLIVQVETREALDRIEDILAVSGVDVALVGPNDLSIALGKPGNLDDPPFIRAIERTVAACRRRAVVPAIHVNDLERAVAWARKGMRMVSISSEAGLMIHAGANAAVAVKKAFEEEPQ